MNYTYRGFITPIGVIQAYAGSGAPDGWLVCDGATVSRTTYADLYAVIGDRWGVDNGSTTFHLPDLRAKFLRGRTTSSGTNAYDDPNLDDRTALNTGGSTGSGVGSYQDSAFESHTHTIGINMYNAVGGAGDDIWRVDIPSNTTVTSNSTGGDENRPRNVFVEYIIKY